MILNFEIMFENPSDVNYVNIKLHHISVVMHNNDLTEYTFEPYCKYYCLKFMLIVV